MESTEPRLLPAEFHRDTVFVYPTTMRGHRLELYVDSAGGDWIYTSTADAIGARHIVAATDTVWGSAELPPLRPEAWIPPPQPDGVILLNPDGPDPGDVRPPVGASGMLGQRWFAERVWEIDYPQERVLVHAVSPSIGGTCVPLAFQEREGVRLCHFGRMQVMIDGTPLDMLFDTGAHTRLSGAAGRVGVVGSVTATSFIIESIADGWAAAHPDWPVVRGAEAGSGAAMIRVPAVQIGEVRTGPIWFTCRPDVNLLEHMSQWMDRPVVGAIGGNAFRRYRLIVDYPAAKLHIDGSHDLSA